MVDLYLEVRVGSVLYEPGNKVIYTVTEISPGGVFVTWEGRPGQISSGAYYEDVLRAHLREGKVFLAEEEFW